jgi:hypothetical protein
MAMNWRGRRRESGLEQALRKHRPEPREEFVRALAAGVSADASRRPRAIGSRLAFAAAISVLLVGVTLSFGALSYAKSSAATTYHVVKQAVVKHKVTLSVHSSASDQYSPPTSTGVAGKNVSRGGGEAPPAGQALAATGTGTLPFTGVSLVTAVVVAVALMALGFGLRRREQRRS